MVFVWRGLGMLSLVVPFGVLLASQLSVDALMGTGYYSSHKIVPSLSLAIGGVLVWFVGRYVNDRKRRYHTFPDTGKTIMVKKPHMLFWIPMEWMAIPIIAFAGLMFFR